MTKLIETLHPDSTDGIDDAHTVTDPDLSLNDDEQLTAAEAAHLTAADEHLLHAEELRRYARERRAAKPDPDCA